MPSAPQICTPSLQQHRALHLLEVLKKSDYGIVFVTTLPVTLGRPPQKTGSALNPRRNGGAQIADRSLFRPASE